MPGGNRRGLLWFDPRTKPPFGSVEVDEGHAAAHGLIGCWLFNEGAGGPSDLLSRQIATPVNGPVWVPTAAGVGDQLTRASSQYLNAGSALPAAAGPYAVALRFVMTTLNDYQMFMTRTAGAGTDWEIGQNAGPAFLYYGWNGGQPLILTVAVVAGAVADVVISVDTGVGAAGYVNGVAAGTAAGTTEWRTGTGAVEFGRRSDGNHLNGTLIHAMVYNRSVSASEAMERHAEPYAFLRPILRRRYFVPAGAAVRSAQVSWAELEVPAAPTRRAQVSWAELELPIAPRRAQLSWIELEVPTAPRRAQVSWSELEVPEPPVLRRAYISWAELEIPGEFEQPAFMNTLNLNLLHRSSKMQSYNRVSQGRASAAGTDETNAIEIINTHTTQDAVIKRITAGLVAATATSLGVGRPAAAGITPTSPVALLLEDGTGSGDLKTAVAWATPPTKPTTFYRMGSAPATIGSLITFTFESGIRLAPGETLTVWFDTTSSICNITVEAEEQTLLVSNP